MLSSQTAPYRRLGIAFVLFGLSLSTMSFLVHMTPFAGLGLAIFLIGLLLIYIPTERAVSPQLISASCLSSLVNLNSLIEQLGVTSSAVYLPNREGNQPSVFLPLLGNPEPSFISSRSFELSRLLVADSKDPHRSGLLLAPPGGSLATLIEEESGTDFSSIGPDQLEDSLRAGLVEGLEIAENVRVTSTNESLEIEAGPLISEEFCQAQSKAAPLLCNQVGCPLCSAIICAATKATKRPLLVTKISPVQGRRIHIELKLMESDQK